jgi:S-adenosylmethionine synthetase
MWERWPYDGKFIINDTKPIPSRALLSADENLEWEVKMRRRRDIMEEMDELLTPIRTFNKEEEKRWNGLVAEEKKIKERLDELIEKEKRIAREMRGLNLTICQSHAEEKEIRDFLNSKLSTLNYQLKVNPLGPWTGGIDVDCGCTNRKLGSDMGDGVSGGGINGKDLSKGDVSINIVAFLKAVQSGQTVTACCSIGDEQVTFQYANGRRETETFADIVEMARLYILTDCNGSFETFSEWGLIRPKS